MRLRWFHFEGGVRLLGYGRPIVTPKPPAVPAPGADPVYVWRTEYDEEHYDNGDGSFSTEHYPYYAIREKPDPNTEVGSHEIGRAHTEGWAQRIVDALNHAPVPLFERGGTS